MSVAFAWNLDRWSLLLCVTLAAGACGGGDPVEPDAKFPVRDECRRYLSCVLAAAPSTYAAALELYGEGSVCWKTATETMNCARACDGAFADIATECVCNEIMCTAACTNDLAFEPNDTLQTAFVTAINTNMPRVTYPDLALCTAFDVDIFKLQTSMTTTVDAVANLRTAGQLSVQVLNAAGNPLATGTSSGNQARAVVANQPPNTYYVRVQNEGIPPRYQLVITAAP